MKKPNHAWILFERSGTFKKAFEKFGIPATDFDLEAEHEEVVKVDIFKCIDNAFMDIGGHIFNHFKADDLIIAFFPCTYFSDQSQLISRCDSFSMKDYTLEEKLNLSRVNMRFRADYYDYLCQLVLICKKRNLQLIIENPFGKVNFLKWFFPLKPEIIIEDRRALGDFFKKPTQFFFVNCKAEFSLIPFVGKVKQKKSVQKIKGFARSRIAPQFAENFIKYFLETEEWKNEKEKSS